MTFPYLHAKEHIGEILSTLGVFERGLMNEYFAALDVSLRRIFELEPQLKDHPELKALAMWLDAEKVGE